MERGAYGSALGKRFALAEPPTLISYTGGRVRLAVTALRHDDPGYGCTKPIPVEDAYLIGLQLRGMQFHELWLDHAMVPVRPIVAGTTHIFDLTRNPIANIPEPHWPMFFYLPIESLTEAATDMETGQLTELRNRAGDFVDDPVIRQLGHSLLPALYAEQATNQMFVDHVLMALRSHLVVQYGGMRLRDARPRGGLAPWQVRMAKDMMREHVAKGIALAELAAACSLSPYTFARGFRQSAGVTPHQWLMQLRVEYACALMEDRGLSLADVALRAGFADQAHFTRSFSVRMKLTPAMYRRSMKLQKTAADESGRTQ